MRTLPSYPSLQIRPLQLRISLPPLTILNTLREEKCCRSHSGHHLACLRLAKRQSQRTRRSRRHGWPISLESAECRADCLNAHTSGAGRPKQDTFWGLPQHPPFGTFARATDSRLLCAPPFARAALYSALPCRASRLGSIATGRGMHGPGSPATNTNTRPNNASCSHLLTLRPYSATPACSNGRPNLPSPAGCQTLPARPGSRSPKIDQSRANHDQDCECHRGHDKR